MTVSAVIYVGFLLVSAYRALIFNMRMNMTKIPIMMPANNSSVITTANGNDTEVKYKFICTGWKLSMEKINATKKIIAKLIKTKTFINKW